MCLVGNPVELKQKLAYLIPLVERLGTVEGALTLLNTRGEDALYLACMNCPQLSYVAGYLAASLLDRGIEIGKKLYKSGVIILFQLTNYLSDELESIKIKY